MGHELRCNVWILLLACRRSRTTTDSEVPRPRPPPPGQPPAARRGLAVHPSRRGAVDRPEPALLRRPPDELRVPADVRAGAAAVEGNCGSLDAGRADVGRGARVQERPGLLPVA